MGTRIKSILPSQGRRQGTGRRLHALPGTRHGHSRSFSAFQIFKISASTHHDLLPFDWDSALKTAEIRFQLEKNGTKIGPYDLQLCGQALALDLTLVTHNTREFQRVTGLRLEDWEAEEPLP
jgi:hypothetical protein